MAEQHEPSNAAAAFSILDKADWVQRLVRNDKGVLQPVLDNVVSILLNDERWAGVIAYDEFSGQTMKLKPPPFERGEVGEWTDMDDSRLELWLGQGYQLRNLKNGMVLKGALLAADAHRYHQVRDYLDQLEWDGTPRLEAWLWAYLGAPRTEYVEQVALKWMVGAVARIYRPGCKMDNVLILEGSQGALKSSALKILFEPWFTDAGFEMGTPDGYQIIRGMWCVELAELDGFNRAEASKSKAFFTRVSDRYRSPYGRKPINILRQGVFAGSVNHDTYLKDDTGNRRYWPVLIGYIGLDELRRDRDQLWAEAVKRYRDGTEWWVRASDRAIYENEQDTRFIGDAYQTKISDWLETADANSHTLPDNITLPQVLAGALHLEPSKWTLAEQQRVGRIMARLGWARKRSGGRSGREYVYVRPVAEDQQ